MASTADTYAAYFQCRLTEVTSSNVPKSFPRLTSAQSSLVRQPKDAPKVRRFSEEIKEEISKKKFLHSFSTVQEQSANHWQGNESSGLMLSSKLKGRLFGRLDKARGELSGQLPPVHGHMPGGVSVEDSRGGDTFKAQRMVHILKDSRFFRDLDVAVLESLPQHAQFLHVPNASVLFRQGDPPKGCYVVVSGKVGFYVGGNQLTPRQPPTEKEEMKDIPEAAWRVFSFEGFSTFSKVSDFGNCVKKSGAGEVFGELALMDGKEPRKASARSLDESELLFVSAEGFEEVKRYVKELEQQKREFLVSCLPGMEGAKAGNHHAANCFHQERHAQGKLLLREGSNEEQAWYVVVSGTVELQKRNVQELLGTLETGQIFGSFGPSLKQPFSARVASNLAEVLVARPQDIRLLPRKVVEKIMAKLATDTAERLRKCCVSGRMNWQQPLRQMSARGALGAPGFAASGATRVRDAAEDLLSLNSRDLQAHLDAHLW
mmetsp:Transcript_106003/g.252966  ORF Transcript_106003/g.252966 Transcript_106003/m.252966 type:complete len:488 (+) Transcript_106003:35-1498(+)|eukprot:CAMPEP_0181429628 /NCGR_PEP_ID=MMETSP1110-20121109/17299_1 /TAXON_ID=174948 /ORGANISM="Symbiodinium sp., Strain CCMP421" /LENGTH=487 /DNA_ID=CAMNT_0023552905 /DNA_START=33 /DNA_END=1496 /DNA_ORIENTATION=+